MIPFPTFEPDKSPFSFMTGDNMLNCLPVADGWGPMPSLTEVSDALPAACLGAIYYKNSSGDITVIAGTATDLYKLNTGTSPYSWDNVSQVSGGYTVPSDDKWSFTVFGDYLIAHSLGDVPQYWDLNTSVAFADLAGSPPTAKYSWVAGDFLVFGYLTDEPNKIRWSGLNDAEFWTEGQRNADSQTLPDGGEVMGGIGHSVGAIIIQRDKMRYMQFAPSSGYTFTIAVANERRGTIAANSIVQIGPSQFAYLCEDGFFMGVEGTAIGAERVDRWFQSNVNKDLLYAVRGWNDPFNKIVWWRFEKEDTTALLLGYDWQLDRWCYSDQDLEEAAIVASPAITWDGLDALYATIDDASDVSFDSRLFQGGRPVFAMFTTDSKLAYLTGSNKAATMETAQVQLTPGSRSFVSSGRVITDCTGFTVAVGTAAYHGGTISYKSAVAPSTVSGKLPLRAAGMLHTFKAAFTAAETWTVAQGIDVGFVDEGDQ